MAESSDSDSNSTSSFRLTGYDLKNLIDPERRMNRALKVYLDPALTNEDRSIVERELQKNKDVIEWAMGYSNLRDNQADDENYFRFCVPGAGVKRLTSQQERSKEDRLS
jgi:hypothetical protein